MRKLSTLFFCLTAFFLSAQIPDVLEIKDWNHIPEANLESYINNAELTTKEVGLGNYYRLIQFNELPNKEQIKQLERTGVKLLHYIPNKAYIASFPAQYNKQLLQDKGLRHVSVIEQRMKINPELALGVYPEWAKVGNNKIKASISLVEDIDQALLKDLLISEGVEITASNGYDPFVSVIVQESKLKEIADLPYVLYLDFGAGPIIKDDDSGRSLLRANGLDTQNPLGRNYDGEGIRVLCRDDGAVFPHADFKGRLFQPTSGASRGGHGDGVSGIMAGAGNINPAYRGMAAGADLFVIDYVANFLDETMDLFFNEDVIVTNSSYSDGCNAGYTNRTRTVDNQCYENPTLMHVFSAGNSNNQECGYNAGSQWGNITGGHKQGKNVLTTANTSIYSTIVSSSSRGPAHDGRIKPDLASNGQDHWSTNDDHTYRPFSGTSGAAPGIAGVMAMLHQAYQEIYGETADAALLKAIMLNTAFDLGNAGPDFIYGWGALHGLKCAIAIEEQRFSRHEISQGNTAQHSINVPPNTKELRVMTYWRDPQATFQTNKALINDLNTNIEDGSGNFTLPLILDPSPNAQTLNLPAQPGLDQLNNMEQVRIIDPTESTYTLNVEGSIIPFGVHEYFVTWEFITDEINVTYPLEGDIFGAGERQLIRWDASDNEDPINIQISYDGGSSWPINENLANTSKQYELPVPTLTTKDAIIKLTRGSNEYLSDTFSIAEAPRNLELQQVCDLKAQLRWDIVEGATSYDVFKLGTKFMEYQGSTADNTYVFDIDNPYFENFFAVSANFAGEIKSRRSVAEGHFSTGLLNCVLDYDMKFEKIIDPNNAHYITCAGPTQSNLTIQVKNYSSQELDEVSLSYQINNDPIVTEMYDSSIPADSTLDFQFSESFLVEENGSLEIKAWTSHPQELLPFDDSISISAPIYLDNGIAIPIVETFTNSQNQLPEFWRVENPDNNTTWQVAAEQFNIDDVVYRIETLRLNFSQNTDSDEKDYLYLAPISFAQNSNNLKLSFDLSYNFDGENADSLIVDVSTDCGQNFDRILYQNGGEGMNSSVFALQVPYNEFAWNKVELDITELVGEEKVIFRFTGISKGGRILRLDNINIEELEIQAPNAGFQLTNDVFCLNDSENPLISILNTATGDFLEYDWSFGLGAIPANTSLAGPHQISYLLPGEKTISQSISNSIGTDNTQQTIQIITSPSGGWNAEDIGDGQIQFMSNFDIAESYLWDFGDGNTSIEENPIHQYATPGFYNVSLKATNKCGTRTLSDLVTVETSNVFDLEAVTHIQIQPNPNRGQFEVAISSSKTFSLAWTIVDQMGREVSKGNEKMTIGANTLKPDTKILDAGVYFLKLSHQDQSESHKIVVQK